MNKYAAKTHKNANKEKAGGVLSFPRKLFGSFSQRMAPPVGRSPLAYVLEEDTLRGRDILGIEGLMPSEVQLLLKVALDLKSNKFDETQTLFAKGQTLAMLFEKPSLRTRVTFEAGMTQLGGHAIYLEGKLGLREPVYDVAKNLDRWVDGIMARTFEQTTVNELAQNAYIPVINGLSDVEHPCQALADFMTIFEHKSTVTGLNIVFVGDGNNVAQSLMLTAAKLGSNFTLACPNGYKPSAAIVTAAQADASRSGATITICDDPIEAVDKADVVYTDTWVSMGQEEETAEREKIFAKFQVCTELLQYAKKDAIVMHCLPAHRGQEVTAEVLDGKQSVIYDQAENRLHAQKSILSLTL